MRFRSIRLKVESAGFFAMLITNPALDLLYGAYLLQYLPFSDYIDIFTVVHSSASLHEKGGDQLYKNSLRAKLAAMKKGNMFVSVACKLRPMKNDVRQKVGNEKKTNMFGFCVPRNIYSLPISTAPIFVLPPTLFLIHCYDPP